MILGLVYKILGICNLIIHNLKEYNRKSFFSCLNDYGSKNFLSVKRMWFRVRVCVYSNSVPIPGVVISGFLPLMHCTACISFRVNNF